MAKLTFEEQEEIINTARKNVSFDTKEFTLELLHSKFNRYIEDTNTKELSFLRNILCIIYIRELRDFLLLLSVKVTLYL